MMMRARLGSLLVASCAALVGACARGPAPPPRSVAASAGSPNAHPSAATPPSDDATAQHLPDVEFTREYEEPVDIDAEPTCKINVGPSGLAYDGLLYVHGKPFARANAFGTISYASLGAEEGSLYAPGTFGTETASVTAEVYLPDLQLYAAMPIIIDGFVHVVRTRIATKTSVKGPFFAPDVKLPPNIRLRAPLREDAIRVPCAYVRASAPEEAVDAIERASSSVILDAEEKNVSVSLTPTGAPMADIVKPQELRVSMLSLYKTTALVAVHAETKESDVYVVGWIHDGELNEGGSIIGLGNVGTIGRAANETHLNCDRVSVFVEVDHKLFKAADVNDTMSFHGARAANGDFRLDLGADPTFSPTKPPKKGPNAPLEPFIPKEYLPRCREVKV
jgi:hypothetical protein